MLTHVHTSSILCGWQLGSESEVVEVLEKGEEKEQGCRTLAQEASDPAWPGPMANPSSQVRAQLRRTVQRGGVGRDRNPVPRVRR